jgi:SAM-dependent methyltransferase
MSRDLHERNRLSWNAATRAHNSHKTDQAKFLREGGSTLFPEELELLGDLDGCRLLHLQCNAGQDSLSLARRGALVTGVDISDEAIDFARGLAEETRLPATFVRDDVYDFLGRAANEGQRFDRVFSSYGAVVWLSDLRAWATGIASLLAPKGLFVLVEFHPVAMMFDEDWEWRYPYSSGACVVREDGGVGDYVALSGDGLTPSGRAEGEREFANPHPSYEFYWGPADVIGELVDAGLVLDRFVEYPHCNGARMWNEMRELSGRRFAAPERIPAVPLMYGVVARRV